jgi:NAD(P)-dependent dehydrogenase (short-subunit alcohol dehydrogenase family)
VRPLEGKVAVVTGGARGIGRATVAALAANGVRVAVGDLDRDLAERAASEIGPGAIGLALDVSDTPGITSFLDEVERELGPLDILVNNAGIMPTGPLTDEDDASTRRQIAINLHGVIAGTREAVRRMVPRQTGHIVNISSVAGKLAGARVATYTATKYAVVGFSEAVAFELHGTGVEISVIYPPATRTALTDGLKDTLVPLVKPEAIAKAIIDTLERPRFNRAVPRPMGLALNLNQALPYPLRAALGRALGMDTVLADLDQAKRADYEARAAREVAANRERDPV